VVPSTGRLCNAHVHNHSCLFALCEVSSRPIKLRALILTFPASLMWNVPKFASRQLCRFTTTKQAALLVMSCSFACFSCTPLLMRKSGSNHSRLSGTHIIFSYPSFSPCTHTQQAASSETLSTHIHHLLAQISGTTASAIKDGAGKCGPALYTSLSASIVRSKPAVQRKLSASSAIHSVRLL
jgi:hypothetical protein